MNPTIFERCFADLMIHEVSADPLDLRYWSGGAIGVGQFLAFADGIDLSNDDSGNWTGGKVGVGQLGGTRWGIDTASYGDAITHLPPVLKTRYPVLVRDLTLDQARDLTLWAYWKPIRGDDLPSRLALLVLDAAFNNGACTSARWLQTAVGAVVDGVCGDKTIASVQKAIARNGQDAVASEILAERIDFMARLPTWRIDGFGWSRRLARIAFQACALPA